MRRRRLLGLGAALMVAGLTQACVPGPPLWNTPLVLGLGPEPGPRLQSVRVMTWNIHGTPLGRIRDELLDRAADAVALQEVAADQREVEQLAADLGMKAVFLPLFWLLRPRGLAILTSLPVLDVRMGRLPSGPEPRGYLVVHTPGLTLVNTHLEPSPRRKVQLEVIAQELGALEGPVVLLGDLNQEGLGKHFPGFEDLGWEAGVTFPPLQARIDYILARGVQGHSAEVTPTLLSDHWPVIATLTLPPSE